MPLRHCLSSAALTPRPDARLVLKNQSLPAVGPPDVPIPLPALSPCRLPASSFVADRPLPRHLRRLTETAFATGPVVALRSLNRELPMPAALPSALARSLLV